MPHLQMEWNPPKFKILGIWFTNDLKECEVLNFNDKFLENMSFVQGMVKETPLGRVALAVLKSLILSKIIHLWKLSYGCYCQTHQTTLLTNCRRQCFSLCGIENRTG